MYEICNEVEVVCMESWQVAAGAKPFYTPELALSWSLCMSQTVALAIDSLHGFELTEDGQYLMLQSNQPDRIALHCSVMHELLAAVSNAIGWSERIRQQETEREICDAVRSMGYRQGCRRYAASGPDLSPARRRRVVFPGAALASTPYDGSAGGGNRGLRRSTTPPASDCSRPKRHPHPRREPDIGKRSAAVPMLH